MMPKTKNNANLLRRSANASGTHFFGAPTGAETYFESVSNGFKTNKLVQPPMLVGRAKKPDDLTCVSGYKTE